MTETTNTRVTQVDATAYYRRRFSDSSWGTEEELSGPRIMSRKDADQLIAVVANSKTSEVLVLITKDLQVGTAGDYGVYTIELRTTPTEKFRPPTAKEDTATEKDEWLDRRRALQAAIWAVENAKDRALDPARDNYSTYSFTICNPDHRIIGAASITESGKQITLGVPAKAIGEAASGDDRKAGKLHPDLPRLSWYNDEFTNDSSVANFTPQEKIRYALVISAILRLATLQSGTDILVNNAGAKNEWGVRPRTPIIQILDSFDDDDRKFRAQLVIMLRDVPTVTLKDDEGVQVTTELVSGFKWQLAKAYIIFKRPLGGHWCPDAVIGGDPVMLFEDRIPTPNDYPNAFWVHGQDLNFSVD
jgi:hypothetical protein